MSAVALAKKIIDRLNKKGFNDGDRSIKKRFWEAVAEGFLEYLDENPLPGGSTTDEKVKVSANDTTTDYLATKLVAGANINLIEQFDGADERLEIEVSGVPGGNDTRRESFFPSGPSDTVYTLTDPPLGGTEHVYWNGVLTLEGAANDYTVSGDQVTVNFAVFSGDRIDVEYEYA